MHVHVAKTVDDIKRGNRYGYTGDSVAVIKATEYDNGSIILLKKARISYFTPKGKARIKVEHSYSVLCLDSRNEDVGEGNYSRYNFSNKAEAIAYYKYLTK